MSPSFEECSIWCFGQLPKEQPKYTSRTTTFGSKTPSEIHFQTLFWITHSPHNLAINVSDKILQFIQETEKQKLKQSLFRQFVDQVFEAQCLPKPKYSIPSSLTKIYTETLKKQLHFLKHTKMSINLTQDLKGNSFA